MLGHKNFNKSYLRKFDIFTQLFLVNTYTNGYEHNTCHTHSVCAGGALGYLGDFNSEKLTFYVVSFNSDIWNNEVWD